MKTKAYTVKINGNPVGLELLDFDLEDKKNWKKLFDLWKQLKMGMRNYKSREPNLPEGLSEIAFCIFSGSKKFVQIKNGNASSSFDTFNVEKNRAEQIKATSIENDLTSFGPDSYWDDLYFLDFYNDGKLDGTFNVYYIPSELIYGHKVNKIQTLKDQQKEGRRPRFSVKKLISNEGIKPVASNVKVWQD